MTPGTEQRYLPRWEVSNRVLYQMDDEQKVHMCVSKDISCAGACLQTSEILDENRKVKLTIQLSDQVSVNVEGKIVWKKTDDNQCLVGILFHNTSQKVQDLILQHAFEVNREDLIRHWFKGWEGKN